MIHQNQNIFRKEKLKQTLELLLWLELYWPSYTAGWEAQNENIKKSMSSPCKRKVELLPQKKQALRLMRRWKNKVMDFKIRVWISWKSLCPQVQNRQRHAGVKPDTGVDSKRRKVWKKEGPSLLVSTLASKEEWRNGASCDVLQPALTPGYYSLVGDKWSRKLRSTLTLRSRTGNLFMNSNFLEGECRRENPASWDGCGYLQGWPVLCEL